MPFSPRKDEVQTMMSALESCKSLEEVAKVALKEGHKILQTRRTYVVATDARLLYGPFASDSDAYAALAGGKIDGFTDEEGIREIRKEKGIPTLGGKAAVLPLTGPLALALTVEEDADHARRTADKLCVECDHALLAHGLDGRTTACSVRGCSCRASKAPKN